MLITHAHKYPQSVPNRNYSDGSEMNEAVSYIVCTCFIMKSHPQINDPASCAVNTDENVLNSRISESIHE